MSIKIGWASRDITPKTKIALAGEFFERVTDEVETPITVTALAIESDGDQAVFCSCDVVKIKNDLLRLSREKLRAEGLDPMKVMVCCPHIHNSYTVASPSENGAGAESYFLKLLPKDCEYIPEAASAEAMAPMAALEFLSDKIAEAVSEAWNNRKPGLTANGFGRAAVGMNRRVCYTDGTARMWGDSFREDFLELEGGNDNGIELLFTFDTDRRLTGIVANIACPAQVMEQRSVISSDYWGKVLILLREKYGNDIFLLPLCAPAGDQCPRDLVRWVEPETPIKDPNVIRDNPPQRRADPSMFDVRGTWKIGKRIFREIVYALEEVTEYVDDVPLVHCARELSLPLRRVTEEDKIEAENNIRAFFKGKKRVNYIDSADLHVYSGILERWEIQKTVSTINTEIHTVRLGDSVFCTSPFELFLDYGNMIRARSVAAQTYLIQLCCGAFAYLPTEKAERHGHYSAYVASGYVGHEGGEILVEATLKDIETVFGSKACTETKGKTV